jgi:hypothetical protein
VGRNSGLFGVERRQNPCDLLRMSHCTTRQHNAHRTEEREILYPWHPWFGRVVFVDEMVSRGGEKPIIPPLASFYSHARELSWLIIHLTAGGMLLVHSVVKNPGHRLLWRARGQPRHAAGRTGVQGNGEVASRFCSGFYPHPETRSLRRPGALAFHQCAETPIR